MDIKLTPETEQIANLVGEYGDAQTALLGIEQAEEQVNEIFADELALVSVIKEQMEEKLSAMLDELGIDKSSKEYDALIKAIRKKLYAPMKVLHTSEHPDIKGKTYTQDDFTVTLVEGKAQLVPNPKLTGLDVIKAHQADVQMLIGLEMYSSVEIKASEDTLAFMRLRDQNNLPNLQSVVPKSSGYCKVKLNEEG
jgi:hypothetical protein